MLMRPSPATVFSTTPNFSTIAEVFAPSMSAMAAPVHARPGETIGVVTIAGPLVRLTEAPMEQLSGPLMACAAKIDAASGASTLFRKRVA
jgi:DNA-binding IclR family transcriptional regulator